jgi:hypothetical protein
MRLIRASALVLALVALLPAAAQAQADRPFTDSWFWGVKAGALSFSTTRIENGFAPLAGVEWLITRNRSALYVSVDRSFFSEQSTIPTGSVVDVKDLTRLGFALLAFPGQPKPLRPYVGVGLTLSFIQDAELNGSGGVGAEGMIDDQASSATFQVIGGLQKQLSSMSIFGQVVALPYSTDFLLNGRAAFSLEVGARWNVGHAIEKIR